MNYIDNNSIEEFLENRTASQKALFHKYWQIVNDLTSKLEKYNEVKETPQFIYPMYANIINEESDITAEEKEELHDMLNKLVNMLPKDPEVLGVGHEAK